MIEINPAPPLSVSVAIPVFNEKDSLLELQQKLVAALEAAGHDFEIIYVDDGSLDGGAAVLRSIAEQDERVTLVELSRNYGQTAAIAAGVDHARGDVIILMDADLQNDPADIPRLLNKLAEGYDMVSGWRQDRQDPWLTRRLPSRLANRMISRITGVHLHDYGCTLKAYRRHVLMNFRIYGEMHRFLPAYAGYAGARIAEIPVRHYPRTQGRSKYGLERTFKVILDLLTVKFLGSYALKPIYLFGGMGALLIIASLAAVGYLIGNKLIFDISMIQSPVLLLAAMFFILGFQSLSLGLMAEVMVRTYYESQHKPTYVVRQLIQSRKALGEAG